MTDEECKEQHEEILSRIDQMRFENLIYVAGIIFFVLIIALAAIHGLLK